MANMRQNPKTETDIRSCDQQKWEISFKEDFKLQQYFAIGTESQVYSYY